MKLIVRIILIGGLTYFLSPFTFWWMNMLTAFLVCALIPSGGLIAFIAGFLGAGLVWMGQAWNIDVANSSSFSTKIVQLFPVDDPFVLVIFAGIVGGLSAGLAAVSGTFFRKLLAKPKQRGIYN